jgi:opacity protein-like surface antigen
MRKNIGILLVAAGMAVASPCAMAIDNYYVGVNVARVADKGDEAPAIYPIAAGISGGITFNENFALEARYLTGAKSDTKTFQGFDVELEVDYVYGVYAKGMLPVGPVTPYLMVGYSSGKETARVDVLNLSASDSDSGPSFGIGVDYPVNENFRLNLEWARLVEGEDDLGVGFKIESLTFGAAYHF